ncbi:hypothetical protein, partial [Providencia sp. PROV030]
RHVSHSGGVDYVQLLGSHTCVCSPRYLFLSPTHNVNYLEHDTLWDFYFVAELFILAIYSWSLFGLKLYRKSLVK